MEEVEDYDVTMNWAEQEEKIRITRGQGTSSFYLIVGSIFILLFCFIALYFGNRGREDYEPNTLDMMRDSNNIFDDDFSIEEVIQEVVPNHTPEAEAVEA